MREAVRDDEGKAPLHLIPTEVLVKLAEHYGRGAKKYDDRNWEKGLEYSSCYNSLLRHLFAWWQGEEFDAEGFHHLDAVLWNAVALRTYDLRGMNGLDDRPDSVWQRYAKLPNTAERWFEATANLGKKYGLIESETKKAP